MLSRDHSDTPSVRVVLQFMCLCFHSGQFQSLLFVSPQSQIRILSEIIVIQFVFKTTIGWQLWL